MKSDRQMFRTYRGKRLSLREIANTSGLTMFDVRRVARLHDDVTAALDRIREIRSLRTTASSNNVSYTLMRVRMHRGQSPLAAASTPVRKRRAAVRKSLDDVMAVMKEDGGVK